MKIKKEKKNFPQFVVIHRVKDFDTVNKTEVDVFLEFRFSEKFVAIIFLKLPVFHRPWGAMNKEISTFP